MGGGCITHACLLTIPFAPTAWCRIDLTSHASLGSACGPEAAPTAGLLLDAKVCVRASVLAHLHACMYMIACVCVCVRVWCVFECMREVPLWGVAHGSHH